MYEEARAADQQKQEEEERQRKFNEEKADDQRYCAALALPLSQPYLNFQDIIEEHCSNTHNNQIPNYYTHNYHTANYHTHYYHTISETHLL